MGATQSTEQFAFFDAEAAAPGETPSLRSVKGGLVQCRPGGQTLYHMFQHGLSNAADQPYLGTRKALGKDQWGEYEWITFRQANGIIREIASGLVSLGLEPGAFVGLYSVNRADWVLTEQACNAQSMAIVPLYDTLGAESVKYIVDQTQMATIVCSGDKVEGLVALRDECPCLKTIISMDPLDSSLLQYSGVMTLDELRKRGRHSPVQAQPPQPSTTCTICYTSGTTGTPKGVILNHGNFAASIAGALDAGVDINSTDCHISYLPLAHVFERLVMGCLSYVGGCIGFYTGDVLRLIADIQELKPTLFVSVPRLFNRIYDKLQQRVAVAGGLRQALFRIATAAKRGKLRSGGHVQHAMWDLVVFSKTREVLGGRVRMLITGSAPMSSEVKEFLQLAFCCPVYEGYGLTETASIVSVTPEYARSPGHVGIPASCCEVKLMDIPDMKYFATDKPCPRGEICVRGANVFSGYYRNTKATEEVFAPGGWFMTGDVGRINLNGTVSIIDRKKNLFKLAQGEYVAPEKVEGVYARVPIVGQCFLYGDSLKSKCVAIIVPDEEVLQEWAKERQVAYEPAGLCESKELKEYVHSELVAAAKEAKLSSFEQAKAVSLTPEPFSVENDLLTPTFKLKRPQLKERFGPEIDAMYSELGEKQ